MASLAAAARRSLIGALPWIPGGSSKRGAPPRLGTANLFLLACRETWRDGEIDALDNTVLNRLIRFLGLSAQAATAIWKRAAREFSDGMLPVSGPLDRRSLYEKASRMAMMDGFIDPDERRLLQGLALALELDDDGLEAVEI